MTSYANGGQLSSNNAEVCNHFGIISKATKWLLNKDAPLKITFWPDWHKVSWLTEFLLNIPNYEKILYLMQGWRLSHSRACKK